MACQLRFSTSTVCLCGPAWFACQTCSTFSFSPTMLFPLPALCSSSVLWATNGSGAFAKPEGSRKPGDLGAYRPQTGAAVLCPAALSMPAIRRTYPSSALTASSCKGSDLTTVLGRFMKCASDLTSSSPKIVKSGLIHPARLVATVGQIPPAENLGSPAPFYVLCQVTSSRCRLRFVSQCSAFRYRVRFCFRFRLGRQTTLLPFR